MTKEEYKKMIFWVDDLVLDNEYASTKEEQTSLRYMLMQAYQWGAKIDKEKDRK